MVEGGAQRVVWSLYDRLDRSRFEAVLIAGTETGAEGVLSSVASRPDAVTWEPALMRDANPRQDARAVMRLAQLFRRLRPDIVHTHTSKAGFVGRMAARLARVPTIIHTPHGHIYAPGSEIAGVPDGFRRRCFLAAERVAARWTDCLTTLTDAEREESIALGLCTRERSRTINNGVASDFASVDPAERARVREELGIPQSIPVAMSVGRLDSVKGHVYFVDAAAIVAKDVPDAVCVLVGSGSEEEVLRRRAAELRLGERLIFLGRRTDVGRLLCAADVFVLPSLYEGFGLAAAEAMAAGLPVVGTRVGGLPEVVVDGETGFLVPPKSAEALAVPVVRLMRDVSLRSKLGEAGRRRFRLLFTAQRMVQAFEGLYTECLDRKGRRGQS